MDNFYDRDMFDPSLPRERCKDSAAAIGKVIIGIAVGILLIDFLGAVAWAWSGQIPEGSFYIGTITIHLIRLIMR